MCGKVGSKAEPNEASELDPLYPLNGLILARFASSNGQLYIEKKV